jgi:hypothetical protein
MYSEAAGEKFWIDGAHADGAAASVGDLISGLSGKSAGGKIFLAA